MCKKQKMTWADFARNYMQADEGATAVEYGLLTAILAVGLIVGAGGIAIVVTDMWNGVDGDITSGG